MEHALIEAAQPALHGETLRLIAVGIVLWPVAFLVPIVANARQFPVLRTIGTCVEAVVANVLITAFGAYLPPILVITALASLFVAPASISIHSWETGWPSVPP